MFAKNRHNLNMPPSGNALDQISFPDVPSLVFVDYKEPPNSNPNEAKKKHMPLSWETIANSDNPESLIGAGPKERAYRKDVDGAIEVFQSQYAIATKDSKVPILTTWRLGPCVCVVLDDRKKGIAAMAHFDAGRLYSETFDEIIKKMNLLGADKKEITARLYSGTVGSAMTLAPIVNYLKENEIKIIENDTNPSLNGKNRKELSILFDVKEGKPYNYVEGAPETNFRVEIGDINPPRELREHQLSAKLKP